ncbi:MAG: hypothetical protein Q8L10_03165 [Candidatus Moranbacteria bacterium]|nr:hypothetical protein [Candidatus Moranbacteria bacterium]
MKKIILTLLLVGGTTFLAGCGVVPGNNDEDKLSRIVNGGQAEVPVRAAEINGVVVSVEGNKLVVKNEINKEALTEEEVAKKKAERQKMTQEERQALRAQEIANAKTEDVTIEIPVGKTILKGTGDGSGESVGAVFEEIKKGGYISIWMKEGNVELVKIKGI